MRGVPGIPNGIAYNKAELSLPCHLLGDLKEGSILKPPGTLLEDMKYSLKPYTKQL